jgi:hypothetical protein
MSTQRTADGPQVRGSGWARGLGWLSVGLGVAQLAAPHRVAKLIGAPEHERTRATLLAVGVRELVSGVGILTRPRPARFLWMRVLGDVMDLALLGLALKSKRSVGRKLAFAAGAVAGVALLDMVGARRSSGSAPGARLAPALKRKKHVEEAITVDASPDELARVWETFIEGEPGLAHAELRFEIAPGGRGTEVVARMRRDKIGRALELKRALRQLKQVIETGEVMRSEDQPEGR